MAIKKVERQLNLVICLLEARQFISAEYIRNNVVGYDPDGDKASFSRMFERDKQELRDMGLPLLTGTTSTLQNVQGYRIDRESYELPEIHLNSDEAAAVAMAAVMWDSPDVEGLIQAAIRKLKGAGVEVSGTTEVEIAPGRISSEPVLRVLVEASAERRVVSFDYQPNSADAPTRREVEPWSVRSSHGRGYLIGFDRDRKARRTFRLSRMTHVAAAGDVDAFHVPADVDFDAVLAEAISVTSGSQRGEQAQIWVAAGAAAGLRRMARTATPRELAGEAGDVLLIDVETVSSLVRAILGAGPDAVVLAPESLRHNVIDELDTILAVGS